MKPLIKSNSTLNYFEINKEKNIIKKGFKLSNAFNKTKKIKKFPISLQLNSEKLNYLYNKINFLNKSNKCLLKKPIIEYNITLKKTRNKSVKDITNFKSNVDLFEKSNVNNIEQRFLTKNDKKNNYLLLTSLYNINLPKIEKKKNLSIRKKFNFGETINNENSFLQNISQYDNKGILNESLSSTNNKKKFNTIDLLYNYHEKKIKNRQKKKIKKLYILSSLNSLLKNKYYEDTEKVLKQKISSKLFPYDYSMRDKVIHLKKFGAFWDSVLNYCVPIINVQKYKAQRDLSESKKMNYLKANNSTTYLYRKVK